MKTRIITHLNADHPDSLSLYLRHFASVPAPSASPAKITDVSLHSMTICDSTGTPHTIAFNPPMATFAEARERTVAMDYAARAALGVPPKEHGESNPGPDLQKDDKVVVNEYWAPYKPLHFQMLVLIAFYITSVTADYMGVLRPGNWYYEHIMRHFYPGGAVGYLWLQRKLVGVVVVVHAAEAVWMGKKCLQHGVKVTSPVFWMWFASTFVEGFGCHERFNTMVKEKRRLKGVKGQ